MVLRLVHILGGIFWIGTAAFTSVFLFPVLAAAGPAAGPVMTGLRKRHLLTVLPIVALLTILSGLRLMMIASGASFAAYVATPIGQTYAISGVAATLGFVWGILVARPAAMRAATLGAAIATAPDDATRSALSKELDAARRKGAIAGTIILVLLVLAAAGMAVARYLG